MNIKSCTCDNPNFELAKTVKDILDKYKDRGELLIE
jgi:hypothetical protein